MADNAFRAYIKSRNNSPVYNFSSRAMISDNSYNANYDVNPITVLLRSASNQPDNARANHHSDYPQQRTMSNFSSEFADRYRARPSDRPHVVGLDGRAVTSRSGRMDNRGFNGFFPSMKLRAGTPVSGTPATTPTKALHRSRTSITSKHTDRARPVVSCIMLLSTSKLHAPVEKTKIQARCFYDS